MSGGPAEARRLRKLSERIACMITRKANQNTGRFIRQLCNNTCTDMSFTEESSEDNLSCFANEHLKTPDFQKVLALKYSFGSNEQNFIWRKTSEVSEDFQELRMNLVKTAANSGSKQHDEGNNPNTPQNLQWTTLGLDSSLHSPQKSTQM